MTQPSRVKRLTKQSAAEFAFHAAKKPEGSIREACEQVDCSHFEYVRNSYSPLCNVMDGVVPRTQNEVLLYKEEGSDESVRARQLRPEQKSLALMQELISQFTKPGDTVVDLCCGTGTTGLACISLPASRFFMGCDNDEQVVDAAEKRIRNAFIYYVCRDQGPKDIVVDEEGMEAARTLYERHSMKTTKPAGVPGVRMDVGKVGKGGNPFAHRFPRAMFDYLSGALSDVRYAKVGGSGTLFEKLPKDMQVSINQFSGEELLRFVMGTWQLYLRQEEMEVEGMDSNLASVVNKPDGAFLGYIFGTFM